MTGDWCVWWLLWSADVTVYDGSSGDGVGTPLARLTGIQGRSLRVSSLTGVVSLVILYLCVSLVPNSSDTMRCGACFAAGVRGDGRIRAAAH